MNKLNVLEGDGCVVSAQPQYRWSVRGLEWLNFFLADVQTGLGPFLAAYLAASGWNPARVGYVLTFGGLVTVAMQMPTGAIVDGVHRKRLLLAISLGVLVCGAFMLMGHSGVAWVYLAQFLIGSSAPLLGPTVAAITLGIVGAAAFSRQFGKNQSFNASGNVFTALLIAYVSYEFGYRAIFVIASLMAIPALLSLLAIDGDQINHTRARGGENGGVKEKQGLAALRKDRVLISFLFAAFLFHLANAAMLPLLGEMLSRNNVKTAAPFMSACIIVTQLVIAFTAACAGKQAGERGRRPLLLIGFGVLPVRGILYTLTHAAGTLIAIQTLDGVANCIFGVVSILVIADRTRGTGHFNLATGGLATMVGIGAALSNGIGGKLVQWAGYPVSFLSLAAIALLAFVLLWLAVPETLIAPGGDRRSTSGPSLFGVSGVSLTGPHTKPTSLSPSAHYATDSEQPPQLPCIRDSDFALVISKFLAPSAQNHFTVADDSTNWKL